jgi:hypothetical protein
MTPFRKLKFSENTCGTATSVGVFDEVASGFKNKSRVFLPSYFWAIRVYYWLARGANVGYRIGCLDTSYLWQNRWPLRPALRMRSVEIASYVNGEEERRKRTARRRVPKIVRNSPRDAVRNGLEHPDHCSYMEQYGKLCNSTIFNVMPSWQRKSLLRLLYTHHRRRQ